VVVAGLMGTFAFQKQNNNKTENITSLQRCVFVCMWSLFSPYAYVFM